MTAASEADEQALAKLFRQQSGRLVAFLARIFGVARVDLAEDVAQETLLAALQAWRGGLPPDPTAWLFAVARNRARDVLRRERVRRGHGTLDASDDEAWQGAADAGADGGEVALRSESDGDLLRLMFSCCHPALSQDTQTALILRLVCGFGSGEIAHAFLASPAAMEKRLVRARRTLADEGRLFDVTTLEAARERRPAVMAALYLMFDAGYHGGAPEPIRADLCADAIRLARLLAEARATAHLSAHALVALMCLHAARMPARGAALSLVALEDQDRTAWDARLVALGMQHLAASAQGTELSDYHLEAGIAAEHAAASSVATTSWPTIVALYDRLYELKPTPIVGLSRAIARARIVGPEHGLREVLALEGRDRLEGYPFYWAALGDLALRAGDRGAAMRWLRAGLAACRNDVERAMFERRIAECQDA
ncbi:MAG: sigma-70 family RNA polymerase sigma factor [Myxococcota bacterium]